MATLQAAMEVRMRNMDFEIEPFVGVALDSFLNR